ncbi:hypothetical protein BU24DRAFT_405375 [Aaosphaeria arxii CBS 175.79]|uniref:Uncharacterized protein n=1 Tax=Aaosphaeria arxii CBS 175.79 TaxID=1450172 RepID=A0A6A5Y092_9PLEO|nr:uncharacterized protein BU24DRAFT_405375 [Aaosphaeria arxii CBS 175.79]KAF2018603.1 hypothetical protein BU24DRAFT_405375 [Aaosphaeria arxii CBS 175.79]
MLSNNQFKCRKYIKLAGGRSDEHVRCNWTSQKGPLVWGSASVVPRRSIGQTKLGAVSWPITASIGPFGTQPGDKEDEGIRGLQAGPLSCAPPPLGPGGTATPALRATDPMPLCPQSSSSSSIIIICHQRVWGRKLITQSRLVDLEDVDARITVIPYMVRGMPSPEKLPGFLASMLEGSFLVVTSTNESNRTSTHPSLHLPIPIEASPGFRSFVTNDSFLPCAYAKGSGILK